MEIKEIKDQNIWESFLESIPKEEKTFLHSWQWGKFQQLLGEKIWRLGFYRANTLTAICLAIKVKARRGNFFLIPHGPLGEPKAEVLKLLISALKAKKENCCFIRIATTWQRNKTNEDIFRELGFKQAPFHTNPELTWLLDISKKEEDLLKEMRKTTRYLIKQGLKTEGLEIKTSQSKEDVLVFNKIYQTTAQRHDFTPFSLEYLNKELEAFSPGNILIFKAVYQGKVLASSMVIFWQGIGFYHQGASLPSKIPSAYLMQWQAIREAKQRGCSLYNFWGIAESKSKKHPWYGLSLFKIGFGGQAKEYLKTQDLPLSKRYYLTRAFEYLRKWKRHL